MKLTQYVVKKSLLHKKTLKTVTGGYDSDENGAEVILTFESSDGDINTDEANKMANEEVRKVLRHNDGQDWLDETTHEEK